MVGKIFGGTCPYGSQRSSYGYTQRAGKFYSWIKEKEEEFGDKLHCLNEAPDRIASVGEFYALPYSHINMNKDVPFLSHSTGFTSGCSFIKKNDVTPESLSSMYTFVPRTLFGDKIVRYQKEVVPKFVKDLFDHQPEVFKLLESVHPEVLDLVRNYDYKGRVAYVKTLKPDIEITFPTRGKWRWDGEKLYVISGSWTFSIPDGASVESCVIIPSDDCTLKIYDNDHVTKDTKFKD